MLVLRSTIVLLSVVLMGTTLTESLYAQTASKQSPSASVQVPLRSGVVEQRDEKKPRKDWSAAEVYVGPSYLRLDGQDLAGVQVGVTVNPWWLFSLVGTFGYHSDNQRTFSFQPPLRPRHHPHGHSEGSHHEQHNERGVKPLPPTIVRSGVGDVYSYMGGVRLRKSFGRLSGFVQAQSGIVRFFESNYGALSIGSGAQVGITQRFAVEARVEYLPINCNGWLNKNVQATVGLVVRFGPWWGGFRKP